MFCFTKADFWLSFLHFFVPEVFTVGFVAWNLCVGASGGGCLCYIWGKIRIETLDFKLSFKSGTQFLRQLFVIDNRDGAGYAIHTWATVITFNTYIYVWQLLNVFELSLLSISTCWITQNKFTKYISLKLAKILHVCIAFKEERFMV